MRNPFPIVFVSALAVASCGSDDEATAPERTRSVTALVLSERVPRGELLATGVVEPYRQSQVSFEVGGRVTRVLDVGREVLGPLLDGHGNLLLNEDGEPRRRGDVIAEIDDTRFRQTVTAVELKIASTERQLAAQEIELESVATAELESAQAQARVAANEVESAREDVVAMEAALELATSTVERDRGLVDSGAVSQSALDRSEADLLTAEARLEQAHSAVEAAVQVEVAARALAAKAEGALLLKSAQIDTTRAQLAELSNDLERARLDVESCVLRAPFSGRITRVDVAAGSFVGAGNAVASLVLVAPVKVVFTASADQNRQLLLGAGVQVYPANGAASDATGFVGTVYEKSDVADANTRTYRVGIMVRNPLVDGELDGGAAPVADIFPVIALGQDFEGPPYVNVDCLFEEGGEYFVYHLPDLQLAEIERDLGAMHVPRRVRVEPSDAWEQIDAWTIRGLADSGGLVMGDALVVSPTPECEEGLFVGSRQFAFSPGDIVHVGLNVDPPPPGFWVPVSAIRARGDDAQVMLVDGDRARSSDVTVHEASGKLRRVVGEGIVAGARIVLGGAHYVADGDRVEVVEAKAE